MSEKKEKKKEGRPEKYDAEKVKIICDKLSSGLPFKYACRFAGIHEDTGSDWKKRHPEFLRQVDAAHSVGVLGLMNVAKDQGAAWKLLKNVARGDFTDEETVNVNDTKAPDLSQVPKEELLAKLRRKPE